MKDGMNQEILTINRIERFRGKYLAYCDDWRDTNGMRMTVKLGSIWPEQQRLIERAGYEFREGKGLNIPIMVHQSQGTKGIHRRIKQAWGKNDGHIYSIVKGDQVDKGDLIFPIQVGDTCYKVTDVMIMNAQPPYSEVKVSVNIHNGTREYSLDKTRDYICIRKSDIAPANTKAINF